MRVPTTDEMDHTTPEERNKLVGYCEACQHWTYFTRGAGREHCEKCKGKFSQQQGLQITSQRTFNPTTAKRKGTTRRK